MQYKVGEVESKEYHPELVNKFFIGDMVGRLHTLRDR